MWKFKTKKAAMDVNARVIARGYVLAKFGDHWIWVAQHRSDLFALGDHYRNQKLTMRDILALQFEDDDGV